MTTSKGDEGGPDDAQLAREEEMASLQTEMKMREEAWNTEKNQLKTALARLKEELRLEHEQWAELGKEWDLRLQKLAVAFKQSGGKEAKWREENQAIKLALSGAERKLEQAEEGCRKTQAEQELRHRKQMSVALEALDDILGKEKKE